MAFGVFVWGFVHSSKKDSQQKNITHARLAIFFLLNAHTIQGILLTFLARIHTGDWLYLILNTQE